MAQKANLQFVGGFFPSSAVLNSARSAATGLSNVCTLHINRHSDLWFLLVVFSALVSICCKSGWILEDISHCNSVSENTNSQEFEIKPITVIT